MAPSPNRLLALTALLLLSSVGVIQGMRVSPERIAARLRIEREWDDREGTAGEEPWRGRNRRQLIGGTPKEETIQVTAPLFSSRLFEYGPKVGDKEMGEGLDLAKRLHLSRPLSFFGQSHSSVWVLANGAIGFDNAARVYRPNVLPSSGPKLIAPFWNRNDLRNGGKVFYREVMSGRVLERGQSEIRYQYDRELKVLSAVVVTFEKMQPLGTEPLPEENSNTFQVALFVTTNGTFANFIYSNIGWTQGAEAGFNAGDGANFFALPTSGTGNIMYLEDYGNTGIPGEWMFVLEEDRVVRCKPGIKGDTCDEPCASGEWGADCVRCCHCAEGGCNEASGECKQGGCSSCWRGKNCQQREAKCDAPKQCGQNALQMTDFNRCGEPQHKCECLAGYEGDPNIECTDIDECAQKNTCHEKAVCTNTPGRFFCQCQEGFTGDGIAECVASFLYPFEQSHRLPKDRNGRIEWQLKHPLRVFGRERGHVVITTNGLVLVKGAKNVRVGVASGEQQRLDEMDVQGVAPFFAPIDLAQQGQIFVEETTDPAVLGKGSQLVNEQLGESHSPFVGSHALMITYVNVSLAQTPKLSNTFQTLLIGGRDKLKRENMTFAQFLYRDITWSEGAEAGIMAPDKSNSILLPGSGTVGIEQLAQLSNVRSQGTWLYRIDSASLLPCIQPDLQPPYCDARSPPLVNNNIRAPAPVATTLSTEATTVTVTTTTALATTTTAAVERTTVGGIGESEDGAGEEGTRQRPELPRVEQSGWLPLETPQPAKKQHKSTSGSTRRPAIVTIQSQEIEQMPPDAFDDGTVTRTTVGTTTAEEELLSPRGGLVIEEDAEEQTIVPEVIVPQLVSQRKQQTQRTKPKTELRIEPLPPAPATTTTGQSKKTIVAAEVESAESSSDEEVDLQRTVVPEEPPPTERTTQSSTLPTTTTTTTTTTTMATTTSALTMGTEETSSRADISRLFVFNTTKPKGTTTRKVVKTTQEPPKMKPENPDGEEPMLMDFDTNQLLESGVQGSKLSIVVPIAIVLIWLVVLLIVAVFLCCRRRQTQQRLRTLYGPAYQIRPVYAMKMDGASYEEHLEKAAQRLSAELAYQPNPFAPGRYSLYGSYWNISPEGSAVRGQNGAKAHQGVQPNGGAHRPTAAMEISSPRGSNDSGGSSGTASVFNNYIQSLGKGAGGGSGTAVGERDGAQQAEYFASSQRSTARFGQNGNGRH